MATYKDYTISTDFPEGAVNVATFVYDIQQSAITVALDTDETYSEDDTMRVAFKADLSTENETILDALVAAHDATESPGVDEVHIVDAAGNWVNFAPVSPIGTNGTCASVRVNPDVFPAGYNQFTTGAFDDLTDLKRGDGTLLQLQESDAGDYTITGQFLEHVYLVGGFVRHLNGLYQDTFSFVATAPASAPAEAAGTGNAKVQSDVFIPCAEGESTHNIDGETTTKGEINDNLVPVPSTSGIWGWNPYETPSIFIWTSAHDPKENLRCHLMSVPVTLSRQVCRIPMLGDDTVFMGVQSVRPALFLPHWQLSVKVHLETGGAQRTVGVTAVAGRKKTMPDL